MKKNVANQYPFAHSHHREGEIIRDEVTNHCQSPGPRVASAWTGRLDLCIGGTDSKYQNSNGIN